MYLIEASQYSECICNVTIYRNKSYLIPVLNDTREFAWVPQVMQADNFDRGRDSARFEHAHDTLSSRVSEEIINSFNTTVIEVLEEPITRLRV